MKFHYKIAAFALMLGFTVQANAQVNSNMTQANIGATIIAPLVVTKTADMNFGSIAVNGNYTEVVLNPDGTLWSDFGAMVIESSGATAAAFTVTGADLAYSISIPMGMTFLDNGTGNILEVFGFMDSKGGSSVVSSGSDTFTIGATLFLPPFEPTGIYTGTFDVFVNYQ